jgi:hypothetical protein
LLGFLNLGLVALDGILSVEKREREKMQLEAQMKFGKDINGGKSETLSLIYSSKSNSICDRVYKFEVLTKLSTQEKQDNFSGTC